MRTARPRKSGPVLSRTAALPGIAGTKGEGDENTHKETIELRDDIARIW